MKDSIDRRTIALKKLIEEHYYVKYLTIEETETIPNIGIYENGKIIDKESDYSNLLFIAQLKCIPETINEDFGEYNYVFAFLYPKNENIYLTVMGENNNLLKFLTVNNSVFNP